MFNGGKSVSHNALVSSVRNRVRQAFSFSSSSVYSAHVPNLKVTPTCLDIKIYTPFSAFKYLIYGLNISAWNLGHVE